MRRCRAPAVAAMLLPIWLGACAGAGRLPDPVDGPPAETVIVGENRQLGNFVVVQPYMTAADYATTWHFHVKVGSYLKIAHDKGWIWKKTLVIFPDSIGTWLVAIDEEAGLYRRGSSDQLFSDLAGKYWADLPGLMFFAKSEDRTRHALFVRKAEAMVEAYQKVFARLAREYSVFIVAGSILLPGPRVEDGEIKIDPGAELYNAAFLFGPDGRVVGAPVLEAHPTQAEQAYIAQGNCYTEPVFDIPTGRLGVLVGEDALFPQCYENLKEQQVQYIVAVKSLPDRGAWLSTWRGYDGYSAPTEFARDDIDNISVHDAHLKYSLPGLLVFSGAKIGATTFLRGSLWGQEHDGQILLVQEGELTEGPYVDGPALLNLWLSGALPDAPLVAPEASPKPRSRNE